MTDPSLTSLYTTTVQVRLLPASPEIAPPRGTGPASPRIIIRILKLDPGYEDVGRPRKLMFDVSADVIGRWHGFSPELSPISRADDIDFIKCGLYIRLSIDVRP